VALLIVFAFVAGAATAVSPCVLPVLPVALSAGVTGGRRRPLGVVTGLALSFTFATVALVYVIDALGLPDDLVRTLAIVVLLGFGLGLLIPPLGARLEAALTRLVPTGARRPAGSGEGFGSGLVLGLSLGLVYAPCAGPILAGVITVSAAQSFTAGRLAVALAYGVGTAVVLYVLMLGGRRLTRRLSWQSGRLQLATGAVMVLVAGLMLGDYDLRFQTAIANDLPAFLVNPSKDLEESAAASERLADLRGDRGPDRRVRRHSKGEPLPVLGVAPGFEGTQRWFNTPGGRPLTLDGLRGHPVLVDFWTYTCINCIRTLPYLKAWDRRYRRAGLVIVGVHTPEFPFERDESNVRDAIAQNDLRYPVVQDNDYAVWQAYQNQYWPASYFIDAEGRVRYVHFGEGDYAGKEQVIRELLKEAGRASVERQRLYELVDLPRAERHRLTLELDPGVSGYAFTFG
jgi:cytochrome c biogenesis protein CcdA/thiol-disulfide isomerase/thioredoxin